MVAWGVRGQPGLQEPHSEFLSRASLALLSRMPDVDGQRVMQS